MNSKCQLCRAQINPPRHLQNLMHDVGMNERQNLLTMGLVAFRTSEDYEENSHEVGEAHRKGFAEAVTHCRLRIV